MGNLFRKPSKPKIPPPQKVREVPTVTEEVADEEARRIRRRGRSGFRATLLTGELGKESRLG